MNIVVLGEDAVRVLPTGLEGRNNLSLSGIDKSQQLRTGVTTVAMLRHVLHSGLKVTGVNRIAFTRKVVSVRSGEIFAQIRWGNEGVAVV